jgi:MFS family permease
MAQDSFFARRFPALGHSDYRSLWFAQIISTAGSQMQFAALNWQIYDVTHSPVALGASGLVRVVPILLFSLVGGAVADAYDRRKLLLVTQILLTAVAVALGVLAHHDAASVAGIYILIAISAAAVAFDNPARQALIPSLVPEEHLPNAYALGTTGFQFATIAGPVLAGLIIGKFGMAAAYYLNALSYLAVIGALLRLRYRPVATDALPPRPSWESLKEGIAFVRSSRILVTTMTLDFWATFFSSASALLPIFARDILHVGPEGYGILSAFPAAGSLIAGVTMSLLPPIVRQGRLILWSILVFGLATIGFGYAHQFIISALFLAGNGAADTVNTVLRQTIRQTLTPDRLLGRMISVMGGPQLGELEAGLVARWIGAVLSVVTGGVGCVAVAAWVAAKSPWLAAYRLKEPESV